MTLVNSKSSLLLKELRHVSLLVVRRLALLLALVDDFFGIGPIRRAASTFRHRLQNIMLMGNEAVQKELDLNADQQKSIDDLASQMRIRSHGDHVRLAGSDARRARRGNPDLMKMMTEKGKELQAKVDKILNAKQQRGIKELSIQRRDAEALEDEEVLAALKLSDDQKKKLIGHSRRGGRQAARDHQSRDQRRAAATGRDSRKDAGPAKRAGRQGPGRPDRPNSARRSRK